MPTDYNATEAARLVAEVRELDSKASPGEWETGGPYPSVSVITMVDPGCGFENYYGPEPPTYEPICMVHESGQDYNTPPPEQARADAALIARYRTLAPQLADELEAAMRELERLRAKLGQRQDVVECKQCEVRFSSVEAFEKHKCPA